MKIPNTQVISANRQLDDIIDFLGQAIANKYHVKVSQITRSTLGFIDYNRQVTMNINVKELSDAVFKAQALFIPEHKKPVPPDEEDDTSPSIEDLIITSIEITGNNSMTVHDETLVDEIAQYLAVVLDQNGDPIFGETVDWSLETPITGISVDSTGKVTIANNVLDSSFKLVATSTTMPSIIETKTILLELESET